MKTKRRTAPDMTRRIGVVLVLLSHLNTVNAGMLTWISTFHTPLFFVLAWGIERWAPFLLRGREAMEPRREHT